MSYLRRHFAILKWAAVMGVLGALGCDEAAGPADGSPRPATPAWVSAPLAASGAASGHLALQQAPRLVYIAMAAGSDPLGYRAVVRAVGRPDSVSVFMAEGGFDPVALYAARGDEIEVRIIRFTGEIMTGYRRVPRSSRPTVVRVSPANRRTSVPLNSIVRVVFSEPMDSASAVNAVQLTTGGNPVPATVTLTGGLTAELTPAAPLAAGTTYEVEVAPSARSVSGATMEAGSSTYFTTIIPSPPPPPPPPGDSTPPTVSLLSPRPGQVVSADFPRFEVLMSDVSPIVGTSWTLLDGQTGDPVDQWTTTWGPYTSSANGAVLMTTAPSPGPYIFRGQATDNAGNVGILQPVTVTLVASDTTPRLVVRSFAMAEFNYPGGTHWFYAPELTVADAPGGGGLEILGMEELTIPGLPSPSPRVGATGLAVPPGEDVALFRVLYGDWELTFDAWDGRRSSGGTVTARLVYRDVKDGHVYATTVSGPVVPGEPANTYSDGCAHWFSRYTGACPMSPSRVRYPAGGTAAP